MDRIRRDVRNLITANERIQSLLLRGEELTKDEAALVRMCATELLSRVPDPDAVDEPDGGAQRRIARYSTLIHDDPGGEPLNVRFLRAYPVEIAH